MYTHAIRSLAFSSLLLLAMSTPGFSKTVVFFEDGFPSIDNGGISRSVLERALAPLDPVFVGLDSLHRILTGSDLLVLPYGSAFPADAWEVIAEHIRGGNFLVLGGKPLNVPVFRDSTGWRIEPPQNSYSSKVGIMYSYTAPQNGPWRFEWDTDAPYFGVKLLEAKRVFVNAGFGGRYRGLGFMVDSHGNRVAAPVVADDIIHFGTPRRFVYLSFDGSSEYWNSEDGIELIREAAAYASFGGVRLYLDMQSLSLDPGDRVTGSVDVQRDGKPTKLAIELTSGSKVLERRTVDCANALHESIGLGHRLKKPGMYAVRAVLSFGDTVFDQYTSGVEVRQPGLLQSGKRLGAGRDYFKLSGQPYLPVGVNYFSTDPYGRAFFVGQSIGGNPFVWERDFSEMERCGITIVRTGIWMNRLRYLEEVSGASGERLLNAIEAYLDAAARHHMQVIFTFFAFNPGVEMQTGQGPGDKVMVEGSNPYLDVQSISDETQYVRPIVSRFKDVPFLSYDLINEPSYSNIEHLWKGNSPTGGPAETRAWQNWLEKRYVTIDSLATAWHVTPVDLGSFDKVSLPDFTEIQPLRDNNSMNVRAVDYNHFAQYAFNSWANEMIRVIRSAGSSQIVTVGQDEGGVTDRILNQFIAVSNVAYTTNHTWWQDDALLWDSVVPKSLQKPNLIEETGPQPVWSLDGTWRFDDVNGFGLEERKLVLSFANSGAGVLHWDWTRSDDFGLMRRDGSQKTWLTALNGIASFARDAGPYATDAKFPEIALVLPQSLQLSVFNKYAIEAQQKSVRALYQYARGAAFVVGEYQLNDMPQAKLIIVPSPCAFNQKAWEVLMSKVKAGATLLISGRVDADEHWNSVPSRAREWGLRLTGEALRAHYAEVKWPGDSARLSYPGDKTTYLDCGLLPDGKTFAEISFGKGRIFYFAFPLELSDNLGGIGRIYRFAMEKAGITEPYSTTCEDPGILIAPTQLHDATLYALASESSSQEKFEFRDNLSGARLVLALDSGRGALILVRRDGKVISNYNSEVR